MVQARKAVAVCERAIVTALLNRPGLEERLPELQAILHEWRQEPVARRCGKCASKIVKSHANIALGAFAAKAVELKDDESFRVRLKAELADILQRPVDVAQVHYRNSTGLGKVEL